jgi:hypothetical protein
LRLGSRDGHGTVERQINFAPTQQGREESDMRSMLLWFIGVPIPIILLLALCTHHF